MYSGIGRVTRRGVKIERLGRDVEIMMKNCGIKEIECP